MCFQTFSGFPLSVLPENTPPFPPLLLPLLSFPSSPPLAGGAVPQVLQPISAVRHHAVRGQRGRRGRRRNAVLGDRLVAEEVGRQNRRQRLGELRAQTVVEVGQHSGNGGQEPAVTRKDECYITIDEKARLKITVLHYNPFVFKIAI